MDSSNILRTGSILFCSCSAFLRPSCSLSCCWWLRSGAGRGRRFELWAWPCHCHCHCCNLRKPLPPHFASHFYRDFSYKGEQTAAGESPNWRTREEARHVLQPYNIRERRGRKRALRRGECAEQNKVQNRIQGLTAGRKRVFGEEISAAAGGRKCHPR